MKGRERRRGPLRRQSALLLTAVPAVLLLPTALAAQDAPVPLRAGAEQPIPGVTGPCVEPDEADLLCIELLPTGAAEGARGVVELGPPPSPFGVAVTADGSHRYRLTAWIEGLPDPGALGDDLTAWVAWAATPAFGRVLRLGEVRNGTTDLGTVSLDKFTLLVSAERSPDVEERTGRLGLRGRSPSSLMEAHDLLSQAPAALRAPAAAGREATGDEEAAAVGGGGGHGGHGGHAIGAEWVPPPMYPGLEMLPGMGGVRPDVAPFLPVPPELPRPPERADAPASGGHDPDAAAPRGPIPRWVLALPEARSAEVVDLPDGGTLDLEAGFVRREIDGRTLVMLAFNGQHPGPLLRVREASTIFVNLVNRTSMPTSVHWHGIRLENRFDGVPGVTQEAVEPGESFRYRIHFPDPGIYWYHPHHREDVQQEMGLYGNLRVDARAEGYYRPVDREEHLLLDDLLLDGEGLVPFGAGSANYALMGRFGNRLLVNGEPEWELRVRSGEVVRFFLTNVANTRTFNVSFVRDGGDRGAGPDSGPALAPAPSGTLPMKVVASDVGRFERETWAPSAVLAPAERYVVEVRFDEPGSYRLVNRVKAIDHRQGRFFPEERILGTVRVEEEPVSRGEGEHAHSHETLRTHHEVIEDIDRYRHRFDDEPDRELVLAMETSDLPPVLESAMRYDRTYFNPVEWAGTMPMMNWASTGHRVRWILRDPATGAENLDIDWDYAVGDVIKIRIENERDAFHAMQHPLHIHGQRFLVLARDGTPNENLVWKDTVLLPTGSVTDILLELSNPGRWMIHCHIAEHLESGMKFIMDVRSER